MKVKIKLVIGAINYSDGGSKLVVTDETIHTDFELPSFELSEAHNLEDEFRKLVAKYTKLSFVWLTPRLVHVAKHGQVVSIYYGCMMPADTKLLHGNFAEEMYWGSLASREDIDAIESNFRLV